MGIEPDRFYGCSAWRGCWPVGPVFARHSGLCVTGFRRFCAVSAGLGRGLQAFSGSANGFGYRSRPCMVPLEPVSRKPRSGARGFQAGRPLRPVALAEPGILCTRPPDPILKGLESTGPCLGPVRPGIQPPDSMCIGLESSVSTLEPCVLIPQPSLRE